MRFPIVLHEVVPGSCRVEPTNLSLHLIHSLSDQGIVDIRADRFVGPDCFELPIESGPILTALERTWYLRGEFHVGCTADKRSPSFSFEAAQDSIHATTGQFVVRYERELTFEAFEVHQSYRDPKTRNRDLLQLAHAYNLPGNHVERAIHAWYREKTQGMWEKTQLRLEFVDRDYCRVELDSNGNGNAKDCEDLLRENIQGTRLERSIEQAIPVRMTTELEELIHLAATHIPLRVTN